MGLGGLISWQQARLFACYRLAGFFPGRKSIVIYELSSPGKVVTWLWMHNPRSPLTFVEPLVPADVYQRQMQALCDLVIERTGLQLQDLTPLEENEEGDSNGMKKARLSS